MRNWLCAGCWECDLCAVDTQRSRFPCREDIPGREGQTGTRIRQGQKSSMERISRDRVCLGLLSIRPLLDSVQVTQDCKRPQILQRLGPLKEKDRENIVLQTPVSLGDLGHSGMLSVVDTLLLGNKDKENHRCVFRTDSPWGQRAFPIHKGHCMPWPLSKRLALLPCQEHRASVGRGGCCLRHSF